ncbi:hypothetical protein [Breoghania sp.]|uniref:hypothetical protein n=1 Tax=Breoghania sp. TaxID=2065378 RepID=UPI002638723F|nr:hypothetical protein [Breoghania sp.]MDJ0931061.1 hypothetical protein [Breoghania sp.]
MLGGDLYRTDLHVLQRPLARHLHADDVNGSRDFRAGGKKTIRAAGILDIHEDEGMPGLEGMCVMMVVVMVLAVVFGGMGRQGGGENKRGGQRKAADGGKIGA